jgi:hypothetical protein
MSGRTQLAVAVVVALAATAGGVALAARWGSHTPAATANGQVTVAAARARGVRLAAGRYPAVYCASYGNVATQTGVTYSARLNDGLALTLTDSLARAPGAQDPARVALSVTGVPGGGRYAWGPGRPGRVVVGDSMRTAEIDARLVGPAGDTLAVRAAFACVAPRFRRQGGRAPGAAPSAPAR